MHPIRHKLRSAHLHKRMKLSQWLGFFIIGNPIWLNVKRRCFTHRVCVFESCGICNTGHLNTCSTTIYWLCLLHQHRRYNQSVLNRQGVGGLLKFNPEPPSAEYTISADNRDSRYCKSSCKPIFLRTKLRMHYYRLALWWQEYRIRTSYKQRGGARKFQGRNI